MTTIRKYQFTCPDCKGMFLSHVLASFGFVSIDENLCRKYWGYNPLRLMITMCPHCSHIGFPNDYDMVESSDDANLPWATESCEKYEMFAEGLIEENATENYLAIAHWYHQGACCRKLEQQDSKPLFRKANKYYRKAKELGISKIGEQDIDHLIERTEV